MYNIEQEKIIEVYHERIQQFESDLEANKRLSTKFSYLRLAIFILSLPAIYFTVTFGTVVVMAVVVLIMILFVQAVLRQQKYDKLVKTYEYLILINENEIDAVSNFQNTYYDGSKFEASHHFYSDDLDIFGANSLFALINRARTFDGVRHLSNLFLDLPSRRDINERQEAVKDLSSKIEWRQDFATTLYNIEGGHDRDFATEIDEELKLDLGFVEGGLLTGFMRAVPFLWLGVIALYFVNTDFANSVAAVLFFFNLLVTFRRASETFNIQNHLSNASIMLRSYREALDIIFSAEWESKLLKSKVSSFKTKAENSDSVEVLSKLQKIIEHLDYRLNLIPAIVLNGLVLWDFRVLNRLAKWKREHAGKLTELFEFIGQMESMSSLATWSYNNPDYVYPDISEDYFMLDTANIRHPLIPLSQNVGNDFSIKQGEHLNIVTGSNMSGKSTLLRTIGINMILGYTGTVVAAGSFVFPIVKLISYMRIKDILEESVSTFKAELNRIQMILDILKTDAQCFLLIDEMLRGTNSKDKLTGSIGIAKRLLAEKTYAMIATHDIKLAELGSEIEDGIANYYFDIDYADGDLVFDYKVKEGICENFNASFLLGQLGIEME